MQSFYNLDRINGGTANLHRYANSAFVVRIQPEQANGAVLLAERRTANIKDILKALQINSSINAQIRTRTLWQLACELHVHSDGTVLHRGINAHHAALDTSDMCIHQCRLANLHIARLSLCN